MGDSKAVRLLVWVMVLAILTVMAQFAFRAYRDFRANEGERTAHAPTDARNRAGKTPLEFAHAEYAEQKHLLQSMREQGKTHGDYGGPRWKVQEKAMRYADVIEILQAHADESQA